MTLLPNLRGARGLVIGQLVGQVSLIAVVPLLTRLYSTDQFGSYQLALAGAMVAQPLATLRLEFIIPATVSDALAHRRERIALRTVATVASALIAVSVLAAVGLVGVEADVVFGLAAITAAYGWMAVDNAVMIRNHQLRRLAARNALSGVLAALLQVVGGLASPSAIVLVGALAAGRAVAVAVTRQHAHLPVRREGVAEPPEAPYGMRRATVTIASGLVASGAVQGPLILVGAILGSGPLAQVGVAQRVAGAPATLVGQGIAQALVARVAPIVRGGLPGVSLASWRFVRPLLAVAAAISMSLILLGPRLAGPILGSEWTVAGTALAILAVPLALQLVTMPLGPVLVMLERESALMAFQMVRLMVVCGATTIAAAITHALEPTLVAAAAAWTLAYGVYLLGFFGFTRAFDRTHASADTARRGDVSATQGGE
jgi:O-antigen/teichoic acid export membrane protein